MANYQKIPAYQIPKPRMSEVYEIFAPQPWAWVPGSEENKEKEIEESFEM